MFNSKKKKKSVNASTNTFFDFISRFWSQTEFWQAHLFLVSSQRPTKWPCWSATCPTGTTRSSKLPWWTCTTSPTCCGSSTSRWCRCWTSPSRRWETPSTSSCCCCTRACTVRRGYIDGSSRASSSVDGFNHNSPTRVFRSAVLRRPRIRELRQQLHGAGGRSQPVPLCQLLVCAEHPEADAGEGDGPQRVPAWHVQEEVSYTVSWTTQDLIHRQNTRDKLFSFLQKKIC